MSPFRPLYYASSHWECLCFLSKGQGPLPHPSRSPFSCHLGHNASPAERVWGAGGEEDGRTSGNQKVSLGGLLEGEQEAAFKCREPGSGRQQTLCSLRGLRAGRRQRWAYAWRRHPRLYKRDSIGPLVRVSPGAGSPLCACSSTQAAPGDPRSRHPARQSQGRGIHT